MRILRWLGGGFYLLQKIFLSLMERAELADNPRWARRWRIISWVFGLVGLPPWVIIFIGRHNWIAASVEASGMPAMIMGLMIAIRGGEKKKVVSHADLKRRRKKEDSVARWLDGVAGVCIVTGFGISLYDFSGINTLNQWLEVGLVIGFLIGTYLLAKKRPSGYAWFVLMHISCGWLLFVQGDYLWLQQLASLGFIVDAYLIARRRKGGQARKCEPTQ